LCIAAKVLAVDKYIARLLDGVTPCKKKGTKITKLKSSDPASKEADSQMR
jgi:hypothetical protein